ncbi:MAG: hypothetical protein ACLUIQ_10670 [Dialister invisus]
MTEPEKKRKTIGAEFIHVFQEEANKLEDVKFLVRARFIPMWWKAAPLRRRPSNPTTM